MSHHLTKQWTDTGACNLYGFETPKYKHDCLKCKFVGRIDKCDGYICEDDNNPDWASVILRYGDDGPDYTSVSMLIAERPTSGRYHELLILKLTLEGKAT